MNSRSGRADQIDQLPLMCTEVDPDGTSVSFTQSLSSRDDDRGTDVRFLNHPLILDEAEGLGEEAVLVE